MSKKFEISPILGRERKPLGIFTIGKDTVEKFEPAKGAKETGFLKALEGQSLVNFEVVTRLYKVEEVVEKSEEIEITEGEISKIDKKQQIVFGWAYVTHDKAGDLNVDKSGDFADDYEDVEKTAYDYVLRSRQGDADHTNVASSTMVESIMFTPEKIEKMGIPPGVVPIGWWVGFKVEDPDTWARVESGELKAFSIHGRGTRSKVE